MDTEDEVAAFLELLDKRMSDSGAPGRHRVAFIALRPLIESLLAKGHTMKSAWASLRAEKKLAMNYQTFRMYCWRAGLSVRSGALALREEAIRGFRRGPAPRRGDLN